MADGPNFLEDMLSEHDVYEGVVQSNAKIRVARGKTAAAKKSALHYRDVLKAERARFFCHYKIL
ncbi:hypothetical protein YC2023_109645 [Brassica napus]